VSIEALTALGVAVVSWSLAPSIVSRASLHASIDPLAFNGWRMLIAALVTLPLAVVFEGFPFNVPWLNMMFEIGVWFGGVFSSIVGDGFFVYSVSRLGASIAMPVSYLFIMWTGIIDYVRGYAGSEVLAASLIAFIGAALVSSSSGGRGRSEPLGVLAAVAASLIWAGSMYAYKLALAYAGFLSVAEARALYMVVVLAPLMAKWRGQLLLVAGDVVASALLGYVTGAIAFLKALEILDASLVAIGLAVTPVATQALSYKMADEKLTPRLLTGTVLIAIAVVLVETST